MAIGDAGAAKGLIIYPNTQDRRLGYQNDNQRADDVAATMTRLDSLEAQPRFQLGHSTGSTSALGRINIPHALGKAATPFLTNAPAGQFVGGRWYQFVSSTATTFTIQVWINDGGTIKAASNLPYELFWVAFA